MKNPVIVGYVRSPFTPAAKGQLAKIRPDDLLAQVVAGLVRKTNVNVNDIEDVIVGCAFPEGEQGLNIARTVSLLAGLPMSVGATTVNRYCGSSMQAIHMAAGSIAVGAGDVFICAGVESMTRVPMMGFNPMLNRTLETIAPGAYFSMGQTAENLATMYKITRKEQDTFAVESHMKASIARMNNRFADEIQHIIHGADTISEDGCIRTDTSHDRMASLPSAFDKNGTVTAGTSSPLTDGAAAVLVTSLEYAVANGLIPLALIKSISVVGCDPGIMGIGPVDATRKALKRAGLTTEDLHVVELNEAFAAQSIACTREIGLYSHTINLDGGAIALGHPLGATGARIVGKAASLLVRENKQFALATQCIGGGQGIATILERI